MDRTDNDSSSALNRETILRALETVSGELGKQGVTGEVCLFGGTVMVPAFTARLATKDVDALFQPNPAALSTPPELLAPSLGKIGLVQDAYLAATAEQLASTAKFPIPTWVTAESRKLHRPWFASQMAALRAVLLLESPVAFRSRNLFISENALTRA